MTKKSLLEKWKLLKNLSVDQMKKTKSKAKLRMTMVIGIGGKLHHSNYMENIWGTGLKFGLSVEDMQEAASWI